MLKIDEFEVSLESLTPLLDTEIRFRWPDEWGEAFITGTLVGVTPLLVEDEENVLMQIQNGETAVAGRILPVGTPIDLWITGELDLGDL